MPKYLIANQVISSNLEINLLEANLLNSSEAIKPDLYFQFSNQLDYNSSLAQEYYNWANPDGTDRLTFKHLGSDQLLSYPGGTEFLISGDTIQINSSTTNYTIIHLLLDQILPLYLSQKNLVLHASAYALNNKAYCLVAKSGGGKSTLVSKLSEANDFISDDYSLIESGEVWTTYPGYRTVSEKQLAKNFNPVLNSHFTPGKSFPIQAIILLNRDASKFKPDTYQIKAINQDQMLKLMLEQVICLRPDLPETQVFILDELSKLLNQVNCQQLNYSDLSNVNAIELLN